MLKFCTVVQVCSTILPIAFVSHSTGFRLLFVTRLPPEDLHDSFIWTYTTSVNSKEIEHTFTKYQYKKHRYGLGFDEQLFFDWFQKSTLVPKIMPYLGTNGLRNG